MRTHCGVGALAAPGVKAAIRSGGGPREQWSAGFGDRYQW
jgi:hypothetical protein